jgi:hypothetical protein
MELPDVLKGPWDNLSLLTVKSLSSRRLKKSKSSLLERRSNKYVASIGPGVAVTDNRKNCQLNIDLEYHGGFQYSIFSTV